MNRVLPSFNGRPTCSTFVDSSLLFRGLDASLDVVRDGCQSGRPLMADLSLGNGFLFSAVFSVLQRVLADLTQSFFFNSQA